MALALCLPAHSAAFAPPKDDGRMIKGIMEECAAFSGFPSRIVGSQGHREASAMLVQALESIPGVKTWHQAYKVTLPRTREATLTVIDGERTARYPIHPVWPAGPRLSTTPAGGIHGRLVYSGEGRYDEAPARTLREQIATMESTGHRGNGDWRALANFGAAALIYLPVTNDSYSRIREAILPLPVNFPRFFADDPALVPILRRGGVNARLDSSVSWEAATAVNHYALVMPRTPSKEKKAIVIAVQFDAMSAVPTLAPGADAAVDVAFALAYLRELAARPPSRPVLFAFVDGYGVNQRGMHEMLSMLMLVDERIKRSYRKIDQTRLEGYREYLAHMKELEAAPDLGALRGSRFESMRKYIDSEVSREVLTIDAELHELRARKYAMGKIPDRELLASIERLTTRRNEFFLAQKELVSGAAGDGKGDTLACRLWRSCCDRIVGQVREAEATLRVADSRDATREAINAALGLGKSAVPVSYLLGVDLSDAASAIGLLSRCDHLSYDGSKYETAFRQWLMKLEKEGFSKTLPPSARVALDLSMLRGLDHYTSCTPQPIAMLTSPAESFGLPAATLATIDGVRERVDTPYDTAANLDWARLAPQVEALRHLLDRVVRETDFRSEKYVTPRWTRLSGVIVDQSPGEAVPNIPMPGFLTTFMYGKVNDGQSLTGFGYSYVPGLRFAEYTITGTDGRFQFDALPSFRPEWRTRSAHVLSYKLAEDGRITRALDLKAEGKGAKMNVDLYSPLSSDLRGIVFTCKEANVYDLYDPHLRNGLPSGTLIDTRGGLEIRKQHYSVWGGMASILVEPTVTWGLIMRNGLAGNRMILLGIDGARDGADIEKKMVGFNAGLTENSAGLSARDYFELNQARLAKTRAAGIVSSTIDAISDTSRRYLAALRMAWESDSGRDYLRQAGIALANEVRVYYGVRQLMDDTVRAAIFLLLALVPFAIFFERLFFSSPIIYRQILFATLIFVLMGGILWSFHPAFKLSNQTLMVVMAFGIICVSLLVISVVYSKFRSTLEAWQSGKAETAAAKTSPMGLMVTSLMLGISNMRKRKFRTVLTSVAIILITFALVCSLSTSHYSDSARWDLKYHEVYQGILLKRQSAWGITGHVYPYLENLADEGDVVAPRLWWFNGYQSTWRIHARNAKSGAQGGFTAMIGLTEGESNFTPIASLCSNWGRFAARNGCYMAAKPAQALGLKPGDQVILCGVSLELLGVFDPIAFDKRMLDIDGNAITPPDYASLSGEELNAMMRLMNDPLAMMSLGEQGDFQQGTGTISSDKCLIVHRDVAQRVGRPSLGSLAILPKGKARIQEMADDLSKRIVLPVFYGAGDGVKAIVSKPLTPHLPRNILIPILIAGLLIFNTLLSSIAERRKEIYIYTSLGMAPWHIGFLFVAEAITYGLMASIFGYIIGQGTATALTHLGLLQGVTLNYSGTQTVMILLIVLLIVILASLIPAYLASKVAMPSTSMHWDLPRPQGDLIRTELPFTVTGKTSGGVLCYLHDFFDAHKEGVIGQFTLQSGELARETSEGPPRLRLTATVWLVPYDIGVRQQVTITVHPTPDNTVYRLSLAIERKSGDVGSWWRLNRHFVSKLRKQLLGWRKLKPESLFAYISTASDALAKAAGPAT